MEAVDLLCENTDRQYLRKETDVDQYLTMLDSSRDPALSDALLSIIHPSNSPRSQDTTIHTPRDATRFSGA